MNFILKVTVVKPCCKSLDEYKNSHYDYTIESMFYGFNRTIGTKIIKKLAVNQKFIENNIIPAQFDIDIDYNLASVIKGFESDNVIYLKIDNELVEDLVICNSAEKKIEYNKAEIIKIWKANNYESIILSENTKSNIKETEDWLAQKNVNLESWINPSWIEKLLIFLKIKK